MQQDMRTSSTMRQRRQQQLMCFGLVIFSGLSFVLLQQYWQTYDQQQLPRQPTVLTEFERCKHQQQLPRQRTVLAEFERRRQRVQEACRARVHLTGHQQQLPRQRTVLAEFERRRQRVQEACRARVHLTGQQQQRRRRFPYRTLWVKSMAFCPLAKTGSTFWKWILFYVDRAMSGPLLSHDYGDIHARVRYLQTKRSAKPQNYQRIVFVREPYARLFSAYVDKIFSPRWINWQNFAKPAMHYARRQASHLEKNCAHNITFAEFVRYFLHTQLDNFTHTTAQREEHWVPVSRQCGFCQVSYDFIGRQETFAQDTLGILAQLNLSAILSFSDFDKAYEEYRMAAEIRYLFQHEMDSITKHHGCLSKEEALRRLWKSFQIRGMLNSEEFFPLTKMDALEIDIVSFLELTMSAAHRSLPLSSRQSNCRDSMLEAYSTVPLGDRLLLWQVFEEDFKFFAYTPDHPAVFPPNDNFGLPYYRYLDVFDSFL